MYPLITKQSELINVFDLRIPGPKKKTVSSCRSSLEDYFDQQLPDLVQFGFAFSFDRNASFTSTLYESYY